jgi:hypothetical protein
MVIHRKHHMKVIEFFASFLGTKHQFMLFALSTTMIMGLLFLKQKQFTALESAPDLLPLTPAAMQAWQGDPSFVKVGISIISFPSFNLSEGSFIMDAILWFEYDPAHVSTETLGKFSFEKGEIMKKSAPDSKKVGNLLLTQYEIRVKFSSNLDNAFFPVDQHTVFLSLLNTFIFPSDIILESDKNIFIISAAMKLDEWRLVDVQVQHGYQELLLDKHDERKSVRHPKIVFSMDFNRIGTKKMFLIFLPLFFIFFIALLSLSFDPKSHKSEIFTLSFGSVSSLIAYRFIIQNLSPNVGYFMLSDYIFMLLFIFIFIIFSIAAVIVKMGTINVYWNGIRGMVLILFHVLFMASWYTLLFRLIA